MNENLWGFLSSMYLIYLTFASVFFSVRVRTYIDIHVYIYTLVMSRDTGRAQVNLQINIKERLLTQSRCEQRAGLPCTFKTIKYNHCKNC